MTASQFTNQPQSTPPPPFTFRPGCANVQNFGPNLTDKQVREDITKMLGFGDVIMWSEIGQVQDHKSLNEVAGAEGYYTTKVTAETPISFDLQKFKAVGDPQVVLLGPGLGPGMHSPARYMVKQVARAIGRPDLPEFEFQSVHYVQAAWSTRMVPLKEKRKANWNNQWLVHKSHIAMSLGKGRIIVGGGDWNRSGRDVPLFTPNQVWLTGGHWGIDHVFLILPPGLKATVSKNVDTVKLNSDHDGKAGEVSIVRTVVATPPNKPVVKPSIPPKLKRPVTYPWHKKFNSRAWQAKNPALWTRIKAWRLQNPYTPKRPWLK